MQLSPQNRKGWTEHEVKPGLKPSVQGWRDTAGTVSPPKGMSHWGPGFGSEGHIKPILSQLKNNPKILLKDVKPVRSQLEHNTWEEEAGRGCPGRKFQACSRLAGSRG